MAKARKAPMKLVIEFDVTGLSEGEIEALARRAVAPSEESDGQGGKRYSGVTGHPSVSVLGCEFLKGCNSPRLVVEFDVTGLTKDQIGGLAREAEVQAESSAIGVSLKVVPSLRGR
jgi:hypothetical protein